MPIYEYHCRACGRTFSALVTSSRTHADEIECPACLEHQAEKLLSMRVAVLGSHDARQASGGCHAPAGSGFA
ncbi:MAG: zinc ribbon domain-containing protein [Candidatus Marinimicrobia bacterium]|nr:zinc ribbon domain-containing protein [Candidatus Neomarinimicrobiota bacterium]MCH8024806.1 zinc ribbon domain-containing protein [Candidatus Neomarinimicrobiota bacterium]MCH8837170.1 zinc ribbon domain-containing protein [Candidatus Neomarinimicrobiota bacterium]